MNKYNKFHLFSLLIISFIVSCNSQKGSKNKLKTIDKLVVESQSLPIVVIGVTDDLKAFKFFNWSNMSYLFGKNHKIETRKITRDSLYLRLDSIKQFGIMTITAFGDSATYVNKVFVTPGDSLFLRIKNKKLRFMGRNAAMYNFFINMDTLNLKKPIYKGNVEDYKAKCEALLNRRNKYLNKYLQKYSNLPAEFKKTVVSDFKFEYFKNLIFLRQKNVGRQKTIIQILSDGSYHNNETIIDLKDYFGDISLKDFQRPELLNNSNFKLSFISYIHYYFANGDFKDYSPEKFEVEKQFILKNFKGKLQHFAIARLINDYNTFSQTDNIFNLKTLISEYKHNFSEPSYIKKIESIEKELNFIKIKLSHTVLNSKLLNLKGDTLLVKEVLKLSKSNFKVFDFWASWCVPCVNEIMIGHSKRKKLSNKFSVTWINFSIDNDKEAWLKKSIDLAEYGSLKNQYLILNPNKSALVKFLNVNSIPRYVILDNKNVVINGNATRPSYENEFQKILFKGGLYE